MKERCELCRRLLSQAFSISVEGWNGDWRCDCEHARHYVCLQCANEWGLGADFDAGTLALCVDHARVAQELAGTTPEELLAPGVEVVEEDVTVRDIPQVPTSVLGVVGPAAKGPVPLPTKMSLAKVLATPKGERVGAPHLAGLTPAEQDALEKRIRDAIVAGVARDVDAALKELTAADAEASAEELRERIQEMGEL